MNDRFGVGAGLERNDGTDRFGLTEVLGRLGLTDGLGRLIDGLGLGAAGLDIRFCRPLGALGLGADCTIGEGPRLICGLGRELNDRDPIDPPGLTDGLEGICGEVCTLGAELLPLIREPRLLRRDCPQASPAGSVIPTRTTATNKPETRFLTFQGPAARDFILSLSANIEILLSPRR